MRAIGITGFKNSGKTTCVLLLAQALERRGLRVGIVKCAHHALDKPDTDTSRLRGQGRDVAAMSGDENAVFWSGRRGPQDMLRVLDADMVLVEGGKTWDFLPRVLCLHTAEEAAQLSPELAVATYGPVAVPGLPAFGQKGVPAVSADSAARGADSVLDVDAVPAGSADMDALAALAVEKAFCLPALNCGACGRTGCGGLAADIVAGKAAVQDCRALASPLTVLVNGQPLGLNPFTAQMLAGGVGGMLRALKGVTPGSVVRVELQL